MNIKLPKSLSDKQLLLCCILFFIGWIFPYFYLTDLINHLRPFLLTYSLFIIIYMIIKKHTLQVWIYSVAIILLNVPTFPKIWKHTETTNVNTPVLKVMHYNLLESNYRAKEVLKQIKEYSPDVISFQEYTPAWNFKIKRHLPEFHFECKIMDSPFGICVATKLPILHSEIFTLNSLIIPGIYISSEFNSKEINMVFTHPVPPANQLLFNERNDFINSLVKKFKGTPNLIVVGDFNTTQWSPYYHHMEKTLDLKNTLSGFSHTWPNFFFFPFFQLDHIMIDRNMSYQNSKVLEDMGSDHYPIYSEIFLK